MNEGNFTDRQTPNKSNMQTVQYQ